MVKKAIVILLVLNSCSKKYIYPEQFLDVTVLKLPDSSIVDTSLYQIKCTVPFEKVMSKQNLLLDAHSNQTVFEFKTAAKTDTFTLNYKVRLVESHKKVECEYFKYNSKTSLNAELYKKDTLGGKRFLTIYIP